MPLALHSNVILAVSLRWVSRGTAPSGTSFSAITFQRNLRLKFEIVAPCEGWSDVKGYRNQVSRAAPDNPLKRMKLELKSNSISAAELVLLEQVSLFPPTSRLRGLKRTATAGA